VLHGEPGIGKTALLGYAAEHATDMKVLRCVGIEAERELPFAGIHQLVRPCLDLVDRLPAPQAAAMRGALGLSFDDVQDRFLVSLGLLSLLAEVCEHSPVLCCVDDAQWLDRPSAEALVFAARRFQTEPIAPLMAVREGEMRRFETPGVRGNPLALLELSSALSRAQLEGVEPILGPPPVRGAVEAAFGARVARLPDATRLVLLLAAADEAGDILALERAAGRLGLGVSDLDAAEHEGLVRVNGSVAFRHPLARSVVYGLATRSQRRAAHEALAEVVDDPMTGAWHRALVAESADEATAGELEAGAARAAGRGAHATASAALERAAELSDDPARRGASTRSGHQCRRGRAGPGRGTRPVVGVRGTRGWLARARSTMPARCLRGSTQQASWAGSRGRSSMAPSPCWRATRRSRASVLARRSRWARASTAGAR
jgi:hypothetical protein